jgi:hypothetical protein
MSSNFLSYELSKELHDLGVVFEQVPGYLNYIITNDCNIYIV